MSLMEGGEKKVHFALQDSHQKRITYTTRDSYQLSQYAEPRYQNPETLQRI